MSLWTIAVIGFGVAVLYFLGSAAALLSQIQLHLKHISESTKYQTEHVLKVLDSIESRVHDCSNDLVDLKRDSGDIRDSVSNIDLSRP